MRHRLESPYPPLSARRQPAGTGDTSRLAAYTYRLPERLRDTARVGHLVQVPLRQASVLGVIVGLADLPPPALSAEAIRDVTDILDPLPVVTPAQITLAAGIAHEYWPPKPGDAPHAAPRSGGAHLPLYQP